MQIRFKWYETDTGRSVQWFPVNIAVDHIDTVVLYGFDTRHWNKKKEPSRPLTTREPIFENKQTNKQTKQNKTNKPTNAHESRNGERTRTVLLHISIYIYFFLRNETKKKLGNELIWIWKPFEWGSASLRPWRPLASPWPRPTATRKRSFLKKKKN